MFTHLIIDFAKVIHRSFSIKNGRSEKTSHIGRRLLSYAAVSPDVAYHYSLSISWF